MVTDSLQTCDEGQFYDAEYVYRQESTLKGPSEAQTRAGAAKLHGRTEGAYIDDEELLSWPDSEEEGEFEEDDIDEADFEDNRVEDEDWDVTERDFTKQFNRLRQHIAVHSGTAEGKQRANAKSVSAVALLPAVNRPPRTAPSISAQLDYRDKTTSDQLAALSKYASRIKAIDEPYRMGLGASVNRKGPSAHANMKDKSDRATNEQVLDPRTRIILYKMIGRGLLQEINGCVSTGKEANVYHGVSPEGKHLAIKIYKTSILIFKDRDRYVSGEHRFRRGYSRHNPRKMVRMWAEKEMRNLKRLLATGLPCPEPIEVRENILVMSFLGDSEGWASPRLKDAEIPDSLYGQLYQDLLLVVRRLFHDCHLVHADLSEYNILYHFGTLFIIDVSQSVEHDHPHAFDFLRKDLGNVEDFFSRRGVACLGLRRAFDFVTRDRQSLVSESASELHFQPAIAEASNTDNGAFTYGRDAEKTVLEAWLAQAARTDASEASANGKSESAVSTTVAHEHEDAVFMRSYIPRNLNEVFDPERDVDVIGRGDGSELIYANTIGLVQPSASVAKDEDLPAAKSAIRFVAEAEDGLHALSISGVRGACSGRNEGGALDGGPGENSSADSDDSESDSSDEVDGTGDKSTRTPRGHRHEDPNAKRERKRAVKEDAREKRKTKMKKADKKKKIKATKHS